MSDVLRIFLIIACMYVSFRLGIEYAKRITLNKMIHIMNEGLTQLSTSLKDIMKDAPSPNETISEIK